MREATSWNQPEKLVKAIERAGIKHGQTVEATLVGVAVDPVGKKGEVHARFCPMVLFTEAVTDVRVLDDTVLPGPIQEPVMITGEHVLKTYCLNTVIITGVHIVTNGALHVDFTRATARHTNLPKREVPMTAAATT